ncbi:electron transfer flavoprotein subunit alpha/FixB family protein [Pseudomonas umsongensis]|uniref:electron transfer flavoprotein subunit alpha/FixB family protein n=1 Tax=Pseudomonas umsongensis TaxID=198618 RepID=UPI002009F528|nr:FAD-binding protein [Pseudomonas umsongensis]MCK8682717.1 FAD-binding protein [Pseudomonas umsongensis]
MAILVFAEHDNIQLKGDTLKAVAAAVQLGSDIHLLVVGHNASGVAEQAAAVAGVSKVILAQDPALEKPVAEALAPLLIQLGPDYSHLIAAATTTGKNLLPRVAAALDTAQISDIIEVVSSDTFKRPIYAGNAIATVQSHDSLKVITVRVSAFDAAAATGGSASIESVSVPAQQIAAKVIGQELAKSERPELTAARIVVSGGRALGSAEHYQALIAPLADALGGAAGASRAAVDAGFAANDLQVGQTGKIVAPELYIAIGISGAIQHLAGMKDSKIIVAINKDEEAPIFQVADYGLVADLFEAVPQITTALAH